MTEVEIPKTAIIDSGLVGYVVGHLPDGKRALFACLEHTADDMRQSHRMVYRDEAIDERAKCTTCGQVLATMPSEALA